MTFDDFAQYLGRFVVYGGVSVGLFWLVAQKAAEKWIDTHFAKREKEFEHEQAKELQRIKAKLDTVIQGSLKLQEREFKVIPEVLEKLSEAYSLASWLCSPLQQYADVAQLSDVDLEEFIAKQSDLLEAQKSRLRMSAGDRRNGLWREMHTHRRRNEAQRALAQADKFLKANAVFLPDELRELFERQVQVIYSALITFDTATIPGSNDYKYIHEAWDKLKKEGEPLHKEIEKAVRQRLLEQAQLADH